MPAAVLARDDFRTRRVDASWLAVLGTVSVGVSWHTLGWRTMLLQTAGNAALLLLSGTALFGYLRLRRLSVRHAFGAGDVLFLLAVAPLFAPTEFLWFLIAACVVALLWWVCCGRRRRTIPFVGAAGIVLIGWAARQFLSRRCCGGRYALCFRRVQDSCLKYQPTPCATRGRYLCRSNL